MNILVTAGNTQVPIDRVRCISNIFSGRTGARIALHAHARSHHVTLLTSHPQVVADLHDSTPPAERWTLRPYHTFDDLRQLLAEGVPAGVDAIIHSAAVSDYLVAGIYAPDEHTHFAEEGSFWHSTSSGPPNLVRQTEGKVKSDAPELWLRLVRAPKLIDLFRSEWGFTGVLVKFKLEVAVNEERLLEIAERSRQHSAADLMVANTLEGAASWAYLGPLEGAYQRVSRRELEERLLEAVEQRHATRRGGHG